MRVAWAVLFLALAGHAPARVVPCDAAAWTFAVTAKAPPAADAQEPMLIQGDDVVPQYKLARFKATNVPVGWTVFWDVYPFENTDSATQKLKSVFEFVAPPGVYKVRVRAFKDEEVIEAWKTVTVQGATPTPGPTPGPTPTPTPPPAPPPIAGAGNRVLIVYETSDVLPAKQAAILTSGVLRDYLDATTAKDAANPNGAYRIWDKDTDLSHPSVSPSWKAAMARPRASVPWIVLSDGTTGYEGPLPESVEATLELLKKHLRGR